METIILIIHVVLALALIGLILIQQGKGADAGVAIGASGGAQSFFGSQGSGSFLTRATTILAIAFFVTSLILAQMTIKRVNNPDGILGSDPFQQETVTTDVPVTDTEVVVPSTSVDSDVPNVD